MAILRELDIKYRFKEVDCDITEKLLDAPDKVAKVFSFLSLEPKEQFIVVNLSQQHTILSYEVVATGSANSITIRTAEVFKTAIMVNSPAIILVHNHPSGDPTHSTADISFTERIVKAAKHLQIAVLDHVIVAQAGYTSLKQEKGELFDHDNNH